MLLCNHLQFQPVDVDLLLQLINLGFLRFLEFVVKSSTGNNGYHGIETIGTGRKGKNITYFNLNPFFRTCLSISSFCCCRLLSSGWRGPPLMKLNVRETMRTENSQPSINSCEACQSWPSTASQGRTRNLQRRWERRGRAAQLLLRLIEEREGHL